MRFRLLLLISALSFPLFAFSQTYYTPGSGARYQGSAEQPQLAVTPTGETVDGKPVLAPRVMLGSSVSTTATAGAQAVKAVTTAGTPVALAATSTLVETVEIIAMKNRTTANTGNIYIGFTAGVGTQLRVMIPGEVWQLTAPPGKKLDLAGVYIDAVTSADAVIYSSLN